MVRRFRFIVISVIFTLLASILAGAQDQEKPKYHNPNIPDARSESEAKALAYMKTVLYAQNLYKKKHKKYAASLMALVGSGSFTRRMVNTDRGDYTASFARGFSLLMMPKTQDATHRSFWVNEGGTIRAEEDKPATAESPVLKPDSQ